MRTLSATAMTAKDQRVLFIDWLLEAPALGLAIAYRTSTLAGSTTADVWSSLLPPPLDEDWSFSFSNADAAPGVWEHRYLDLGDLEISSPLTGGLATVQALNVTLVESGEGMSPKKLWDRVQRMQGVQITLSLLFSGEPYQSRITIFTGVIDTTPWRLGSGQIQAVDETFPANFLLPQTLVSSLAYPQAPESSLGRPIPLWYGRAGPGRLALIPLLPVNKLTQKEYLASTEPLARFGRRIALWPPNARTELELVALAQTADAETALLTLRRPITGDFFQPRPALTLETGRVQNVQDRASAIDGDPTTLALIRTQAETFEGDGYGYLGVQFTAPVPTGIDTVQLRLRQIRRAPSSAATVSASLILNLLDPETSAVVTENLWTSPDMRWFSAPRDMLYTVTPVAIDGNFLLEAFLAVRNEGGLGTGPDHFELGELEMEVGYRPKSVEEPLYAAASDGTNIHGRVDTSGGITGEEGAPIENPADVLRSICQLELNLRFDRPSFTAVREALKTTSIADPLPRVFDGGLGAGWSVERQDARELLDSLAFQAGCLLVPDGQGRLKLLQLTEQSPVHVLDSTNILVQNPEAEASAYQSSLQVELSRVDQVANSLRIRYGWHPGLQQFTSVMEAGPKGVTPVPLAGNWGLMVEDSIARYGLRPEWTYDASWMSDEGTAAALMQAQIALRWTQHCVVSLETTLAACHVEVGDWVTITDPQIPALVNGAAFRVIGMRWQLARGHIWLQCTRPLVPSYEPLRIETLAGPVYWWIDFENYIPGDTDPNPFNVPYRASITTGVLTDTAYPATRVPEPVVMTAGPGGLSLHAPRAGETYPARTWLEVRDSTNTPWYLVPDPTTHLPVAQASPPATGQGYVGSPPLRAFRQGFARFVVSPAGTIGVQRVPAPSTSLGEIL